MLAPTSHEEQRSGKTDHNSAVADIPVRRLLRMEYEEGWTESNGTVLRSVPGDWLLPFLHQRYDDPSAEGIEIR